MEKNSHFDIAIIGLGASGIHLLNELLPTHLSIVIFDISEKKNNDKTWSFWDKDETNLDRLVYKKWHCAKFYSQRKKLSFELSPYTYKTIQSIDFYNYANQLIHNNSNCTFFNDEVLSITEEKERCTVHTLHRTFSANFVFDSRMPESFTLEKDNYNGVSQHFAGWTIQCETPTFDTSCFTMMDFRITDDGTTSFTYLLPFSETEALIEFTYFSTQTFSLTRYEQFIQQYIQTFIKKPFRITHKENGIIPMNMYPFQNGNKNRWIKIGTAGGAVKPSSGYSFRFAQKQAKRIVKQIQNKEELITFSQAPRYRFYDSIFLGVLQQNNALGELLFERLYSRNSIQDIFKFLDEESSFLTDIKIISSFITPKFFPLFIKELFKHLCKN